MGTYVCVVEMGRGWTVDSQQAITRPQTQSAYTKDDYGMNKEYWSIWVGWEDSQGVAYIDIKLGKLELAGE